MRAGTFGPQALFDFPSLMIESTATGRTRLTAKRKGLSGVSDRLYIGILFTGSAVVFLMIVGLMVELYLQSQTSIHKFGWVFFTGNEWDPVTSVFSMKAFAMGTLYTSFWALLFAVPISVGAAIFLSESAPGWLKTPLSFLIELLAAIPSVVYGLWGIFVMIPWLVEHVEKPLADHPVLGKFFLFNAPPFGNDFLSASALLAVMIIPIITGISRDVLRAVPNSMREASLALGATRWDTIRKVVLPSARAGLIGAVILGLGRAMGETMAVTMVIGNNPDFNWSLFSPGDTMASVIANQFAEAPLEIYRSALFEIGLSLLVVALVVNTLARLLVRWTARSSAGA